KVTKNHEKEDILPSEFANLVELYQQTLKHHFDFKAINDSKIKVVYNAMYGSGQKIFNGLLTHYSGYHEEENPTFNGISPEPIPKNLLDFLSFVKSENKFDIGLIVDGDADRIALCDSEG